MQQKKKNTQKENYHFFKIKYSLEKMIKIYDYNDHYNISSV